MNQNTNTDNRAGAVAPAATCSALAEQRNALRLRIIARQDQTLDWKDNTPPSKSTICTCSGSDLALESVSKMLWMERDAARQNEEHSKIQRTYQIVMEVRHALTDVVAWLDCETGEISQGKPWRDAEELAAKLVIREIKSDAEQPSRASDFVTHGSREAVMRDCRSDFQCLPEWQYVIRELRPDEWHVWQEEIAAKRPALLVKGALVERRVGA